MKVKNKSTKFCYIWKIPTNSGIICYILGDESKPGGRNKAYENGSKVSENKDLRKNNKLTSIQITKNSDISRDHNVHKIIKCDFPHLLKWDGKVNEGILHTQEGFYFKDQSDIAANDAKICEIVSKICTGEIDVYRRIEDWSLRPYQQAKVEECLYKLTIHDKVLLHAAMRGGKSPMSLETAICKCYKKILVITPFPSAIGTFRNYTHKHLRMKGYNFYENDEIPNKNDKQFVKLVSFQKDWTPEFIKLIGEYDLIIVDETHNTSASYRSIMEVLPKIKHTKELHLSGTPFNDVLSNRFTKDQTVSLDIIDLMKISKNHPELHIYPTILNVKDVCNMSELKKQLEIYGKDDYEFMQWLKNNQVFSLKNIFENKSACMIFLMYISINQRDLIKTQTPFYFDTKLTNIYNHIAAYIPSVKGLKIAYECLKLIVKMPASSFSGYSLLSLAKDDNGTIDFSNDYDLRASELENECNKFMDENDKTIILTCNRLTTGVTLEKLNTILNFKKIDSAELYFQIMFRIMTYYLGKNEVNMFNFDSEYSVKIFKEFAAVRQENENLLTEKDALEEIFSCINYYKVLSGKTFEFEKVDPVKGYELFRDMPLSRDPNAVINLTIDNFTTIEQNELLESGLTSNSKNSVDIHKGKGGNNKPPTNSNNNLVVSSNNKKQNKEDKKFKKALVAILAEIAWIIIENNIENVNDLLIPLNIPNIVITKNLKSLYVKMISIRKGHWQTYINDLNYKKTKNYLELVKNLPVLNDTDKTTPEELREKMIEKVY